MNSFRLASVLTGLMLTGLAATASDESCEAPCKKLGTRCARVTVNVALNVVDKAETWRVEMNPETLLQHQNVRKIIWVLNEGFVFYPYKLGDTHHDGVAFEDATQVGYNEPSAIDDDEQPTADESKRFRWCVKKWESEKNFKYSIAFSEKDGTTRAHNFVCDPTIINSDGKPKGVPTPISCSVTNQ